MKAKLSRLKNLLKRLVVLWFAAASLTFDLSKADSLEFHARACDQSAQGTGEWLTVEKTVQWDSKQTAIVICDMWNQHWCKGATARVAEMAPRMNEVITEARRRGVFIIHCPSDTMKYYENT